MASITTGGRANEHSRLRCECTCVFAAGSKRGVSNMASTTTGGRANEHSRLRCGCTCVFAAYSKRGVSNMASTTTGGRANEHRCLGCGCICVITAYSKSGVSSWLRPQRHRIHKLLEGAQMNIVVWGAGVFMSLSPTQRAASATLHPPLLDNAQMDSFGVRVCSCLYCRLKERRQQHCIHHYWITRKWTVLGCGYVRVFIADSKSGVSNIESTTTGERANEQI